MGSVPALNRPAGPLGAPVLPARRTVELTDSDTAGAVAALRARCAGFEETG